MFQLSKEIPLDGESKEIRMWNVNFNVNKIKNSIILQKMSPFQKQ